MIDEAAVLAALEHVLDPEIGLDVVNLGLVYDVAVDAEAGTVRVKMSLTSPGCPLGESITRDAQTVLWRLGGIQEVDVQIVWNPPWRPEMMTLRGRRLLGIKPLYYQFTAERAGEFTWEYLEKGPIWRVAISRTGERK